jgi:hypothetical protein
MAVPFASPSQETFMNEDRPVAKGDPKNPLDRDRADERNPLGSHPAGTAAGAVAGAVAAGAAAGSVAGPVGTVIGAAVGGIAGGLIGKGIADMVDPKAEDAYWRDNYQDRDYVDASATYDKDYGPAYRYGVDAYARNPSRHYDEVESDLSSGWDNARGESGLEWDRAKHATRDAWQRVSDKVERAIPGDSDRDGK